MIIADAEVMDPTQVKFLLLNCQRHKLGQKLEQSTQDITIQAIIILYPLEDHYVIAQEYVERINIPLFFLEERCERIVELMDRFPDLKATVVLTAGEDDSHLSFFPRQHGSKGINVIMNPLLVCSLLDIFPIIISVCMKMQHYLVIQ